MVFVTHKGVAGELLQRAIEDAADAVFLTNREGVITFVNRAFTELYGYTADEVVGRTTPRLLKSGVHTADHYTRFWQTLLREGRVTMEMVNRTKDGRLVAVECTASRVVDGATLVGYLAVQRDLTARRRAEEAMHLVQACLESAADAIYWIDEHGRIVYANRAAERMTGYTRAELQQMTVGELDLHVDNERLRESLQETKEHEAVTVESEQRCKDGTVIPVEVAAAKLTFAGRVYGCAVVRDLSARRQLEAELRQAQKMEAIGRLAGGIAHDFNNLLTAILGYAELLRERLADRPDALADLEEIRKAGDQATALTRHLLAFSRRQALKPEVVDLNELVAHSGKVIQRLVGEDIVVETELAPSPVKVKVDRGQLEQVLLNLVVNARDAMPHGGRLTIETTTKLVDKREARRRQARPGPCAVLVVRDTGCGMTPDVMAHIFEPFFTTKEAGKGTGLGLSTVYGIVKQSGGFVTVDSAVGQGSTFRVFLPLLAQPPETARPGSQAPGAQNGSETILLVEDEAPIRSLVQKVLERRGYTVLAAADATEALRLAERHDGPIHLLLSDIVMPGLSGVDLAQRILATRPTIPCPPTSDSSAPRSRSSRSPFRQPPSSARCASASTGPAEGGIAAAMIA